jgi:hypothetical protein
MVHSDSFVFLWRPLISQRYLSTMKIRSPTKITSVYLDVTLLITSLPTPGTCAEHGTLRLLCLPLKTTDIAKIPLQHEDTLSDYGPIFCALFPFRLPRPLHRLLARRSLSIHDIAPESYSTALLPSPTTLLVAENLLQVSQIAI